MSACPLRRRWLRLCCLRVSNPRVRELAVNPAVVAEVFAEGEAAIVRELVP